MPQRGHCLIDRVRPRFRRQFGHRQFRRPSGITTAATISAPARRRSRGIPNRAGQFCSIAKRRAISINSAEISGNASTRWRARRRSNLSWIPGRRHSACVACAVGVAFANHKRLETAAPIINPSTPTPMMANPPAPRYAARIIAAMPRKTVSRALWSTLYSKAAAVTIRLGIDSNGSGSTVRSAPFQLPAGCAMIDRRKRSACTFWPNSPRH